MDRIRTPYTRHAWLDAGQTVRVRLRWYPAAPGAHYFPFYHLYASGDWSEQAEYAGWPGAGEDYRSKRRFYPGIGPQAHYPGTGGFVGDPEWYRSGVPLDVIRAAMSNPPPWPPPCWVP